MTLTTAVMWQLLLYILIPSGWTILSSIFYLSLMAFWYFDKDNPGKADPMCIGLTLSYILLLVLTSTLILRLIFNLDEGDVICGVFLTFMVSAIAYIASMFEVDYKEWSWLIFRFKRFGMKPDSTNYLQYSDDRQDWGLQYGMSMLIHLLATVFCSTVYKIWKFSI